MTATAMKHNSEQTGETFMKENYAAIAELVEIEELELKIAPSGSWAADDD